MAQPENDAWTKFDHSDLGGFRIAAASQQMLADAMVADCRAARSLGLRARLIFDVNGQAMSMRQSVPDYRAAVDRADVIHADGGFLIPLSRWLTDTPIPERSVTTDMFHYCARSASDAGLSFFLLGGNEEVNAECTRLMQERYPDLRIVGRRHGYFSDHEERSVVEDINRVQPDVLWVGLGKPKEQIFSARWASELKCGWVVTCGGCFNYVTGHYSRAPKWMQDNHLEWIYRAVSNPRQLLWRYVTTTPHALWVVALSAFRNK